MPKILLASGSFLRRFIMEQSKLPHDIIAADLDETVFDSQSVDKRVVLLAEEKCKKIAEAHPDAIVIAADTLTTDDKETVYTKLTGSEDPFVAALNLSGKVIKVFTGCAIYTPTTGTVSRLFTAEIAYQEFSETNLRRLAKSDNPNIRSGALGIFYDAPGFTLIKHIRGTYTGAFGLPMEFVYEQLEGVKYFDPAS